MITYLISLLLITTSCTIAGMNKPESSSQQQTEAQALNDLFTAIKSNNPQQTASLISKFPNIINQSNGLMTPLTYASGLGNTTIIQQLLKAGADINQPENDLGDTPLMQASLWSKDAAVEQLLIAGADVNKRNKAGWTALMKAVNSGTPETVQLLIEHGADKTAKNIYDETAFTLAQKRGHQDIIKNLRQTKKKLH